MTPPNDIIGIVKELQGIPETVTDWDLCPFCMREEDDSVGPAYERHKNDCLRPKIEIIAQALLIAYDALEKEERRPGHTWVIDDALREIRSLQL